MIQAVGDSNEASDVVTYEEWRSFFHQCLVGSHADGLLEQDLGPRHRSSLATPGRPPVLLGDQGKDPLCYARREKAPSSRLRRGSSDAGAHGLQVLMSPEQVNSELKRRYSSTGRCSLQLSRMRVPAKLEGLCLSGYAET